MAKMYYKMEYVREPMIIVMIEMTNYWYISAIAFIDSNCILLLKIGICRPDIKYRLTPIERVSYFPKTKGEILQGYDLYTLLGRLALILSMADNN